MSEQSVERAHVFVNRWFLLQKGSIIIDGNHDKRGENAKIKLMTEYYLID